MAQRGDLILLHGFTQTGRSWDAVRERLATRYRAAVAPDLRGHGAARDVRPVDLASVVADLDAIVTDGATLCGYSMGGRLALDYACRRPERVARLVLVGASPGLAGSEARARRRAGDEALAAWAQREGIEAFADRWAGLDLWAGQAAEASTRAHAERLGQSVAGLAAALRGLGTGVLPSRWRDLAGLRVPVDLVVGERDEKFRGVAEAMAAVLATARVHLVEGAGHAVALEAPGAVAAVLDAT